MIVVFNQFVLLSVSAFSYIFNYCDQWLKFSALPTSDSDPGVAVVPWQAWAFSMFMKLLLKFKHSLQFCLVHATHRQLASE